LEKAKATFTAEEFVTYLDKKHPEGNESSLHLACKNDSLMLLQLLVLNPINLESENERGETPLLVAIEREQENAVQSLLEAGASI